MKISLHIDSAAAQAKLRRWGGEFQDKVKKAVARAMRAEATEIKQEVRSSAPFGIFNGWRHGGEFSNHGYGN